MVSTTAIITWSCIACFVVFIIQHQASAAPFSVKSDGISQGYDVTDQLIVVEPIEDDETVDRSEVDKRGYVRIGKREAEARDQQYQRRLVHSVVELPSGQLVEVDNSYAFARPNRAAFMRVSRGYEETPAAYDGFLRFGRANFMRFGRK